MHTKHFHSQNTSIKIYKYQITLLWKLFISVTVAFRPTAIFFWSTLFINETKLISFRAQIYFETIANCLLSGITRLTSERADFQAASQTVNGKQSSQKFWHRNTFASTFDEREFQCISHYFTTNKKIGFKLKL